MPSLNAPLSSQAEMSIKNMPVEGAPVWVLIGKYGSQRCCSSRRVWAVFWVAGVVGVGRRKTLAGVCAGAGTGTGAAVSSTGLPLSLQALVFNKKAGAALSTASRHVCPALAPALFSRIHGHRRVLVVFFARFDFDDALLDFDVFSRNLVRFLAF